MSCRLAALAALIMTLVHPTPVRAQAGSSVVAADAAAARARFHLGPLSLQPRLALEQLGVDTNPLSLPGRTTRDVTATVVPALHAWLRAGVVRMTSETSYETVYLQRTRNQRATGLGQTIRIDVPLARVRPYVTAERTTTHQRPNSEIDFRVGQTDRGVTLGAVLVIGSRLDLDVQGGTSRLSFDDITIEGAALPAALDRRHDQIVVASRYAVTPLTTFVVRAEHGEDRFAGTRLRDADSLSVMPGLEFSPTGLLAGRAYVGVRHFAPRDPSVPEFSGVIAAVGLKYTSREVTRFDITATRDLEFSFDDTQPYFVQTAAELRVTQAIGGPWDAVGRAGTERLSYRAVEAAIAARGGRTDRVVTIGAGLGYHFGFNARAGFDVAFTERRSASADRRYHGYRLGGSFRYGY